MADMSSPVQQVTFRGHPEGARFLREMARQRQDVRDALAREMREARLRLRLTQPKAAELLGASLRQYGRWEQGASWPNLDYLQAIERELDIDIDSLAVQAKAKPTDGLDERLTQLERGQDEIRELLLNLLPQELSAAARESGEQSAARERAEDEEEIRPANGRRRERVLPARHAAPLFPPASKPPLALPAPEDESLP
jgi:transcriptional regulator with XRE-family HTH domain